jgi:AcrR family transcriptional regulator
VNGLGHRTGTRTPEPSGTPPRSRKGARIDRRVHRSRERLGDALVALLLERPFDSIRVQDVLDRAGVGRSTFYAHFRDKNDLFLSDNDDFFGAMASMLSRRREASDRVAPVRELFEHVAQWRRYWEALVASGKLQESLELAQAHFARGIERRLSESPRSRRIAAARRRALAQALSGALVSLMSWWIDRGAAEPAHEMDALFHRLVWAGVAGETEPSASVRRERISSVRR